MSNIAKTAILGTYCYATMPYRWWKRQKAAASGKMPVILLYYHRVADTQSVAWSLTNAQFRAHIDWLQRNYDLVSMEEAQQRVREGSSRPCVHLTFDDGYAENCDEALPMLIERRIPAAYFVTLGNIANNKPFKHDQLAGGGFPVNTVDQLREIHDQGIEVAAHTRTHPNMGEVHDMGRVYD